MKTPRDISEDELEAYGQAVIEAAMEKALAKAYDEYFATKKKFIRSEVTALMLHFNERFPNATLKTLRLPAAAFEKAKSWTERVNRILIPPESPTAPSGAFRLDGWDVTYGMELEKPLFIIETAHKNGGFSSLKFPMGSEIPHVGPIRRHKDGISVQFLPREESEGSGLDKLLEGSWSAELTKTGMWSLPPSCTFPAKPIAPPVVTRWQPAIAPENLGIILNFPQICTS